MFEDTLICNLLVINEKNPEIVRSAVGFDCLNNRVFNLAFAKRWLMKLTVTRTEGGTLQESFNSNKEPG
ncbi:MAG: hypothetical protein EA411_07000 [Saprospirales bacterium]|nr:MAG: hypothetical protein EA411_07000 [Saprospirales bacterium]